MLGDLNGAGGSARVACKGVSMKFTHHGFTRPRVNVVRQWEIIQKIRVTIHRGKAVITEILKLRVSPFYLTATTQRSAEPSISITKRREAMLEILSQFHPPSPKFTEEECPNQFGRVFIVTGGYTGVGFELTKILYAKNAKVYVAGRSEEKGRKAIQLLKAANPTSNGAIEFLFLDLADLTTIKSSAAAFMAAESRLDVLWNNAGVMTPPAGSKTKQGFELQLGTNCLGPFLFTSLLIPLLRQTAASSPANSVRALFTGSLVAELATPKDCINFDDINYEKGGGAQEIYAQSKVGNILLGAEFAERGRDVGNGIIFASLNPGNLKSELQRHVGRLSAQLMQAILYKPKFGAYTELFAGLSQEVTRARSGSYIIPWGRFAKPKSEIADAMKRIQDGGTGVAEEFWLWCDGETSIYK